MTDTHWTPSSRFALFADCLLVSLLTVVAAIPLITAYAAITAGCAVLRERITVERGVGIRGYGVTLRQVFHSGPAGLVVPPLVGAVLALDAAAIAAGVPGRGPLLGLLILATAGATVLGLRIAGRWRPGQRWPALARAAATDLIADPAGSLLLLLAAGAAVAIAATIPLTLLLLPGPLALAALATEARLPRSPSRFPPR
jgi:hypothetical protein